MIQESGLPRPWRDVWVHGLLAWQGSVYGQQKRKETEVKHAAV